MESENIPPKNFLILKLISIFGYVYSLYSIGLGCFFLYFVGFSENSSSVFVLLSFGVLSILFGISLIFVSRGLWKLKSWSRKFILFFSVIFFFSPILVVRIISDRFIFPGILDTFLMILWLGVFFYLLINKEIKESSCNC